MTAANRIFNARCICMLIALIALPGCELLQRQGAETDDATRMMMVADTVPLPAGEKTWNPGEAMPVPVEPSPFERTPAADPSAMLSDIKPPTSPADNGADEPRTIPKEPIR